MYRTLQITVNPQPNQQSKEKNSQNYDKPFRSIITLCIFHKIVFKYNTMYANPCLHYISRGIFLYHIAYLQFKHLLHHNILL